MLLLPAKLAKRARHIEEQLPITERLVSKNFLLCCKARQQDAAHREVKRHFACLDETLIVLSQRLVGGEPGKCARDHMKTARNQPSSR